MESHSVNTINYLCAETDAPPLHTSVHTCGKFRSIKTMASASLSIWIMLAFPPHIHTSFHTCGKLRSMKTMASASRSV